MPSEPARQRMPKTADLRRFAPRIWLLALLTSAFAVQYLDRQVVIVLTEPIKAEFGLSDTMMGLVTGFVYSTPYAAMLLPAGYLADRVDRRRLLAGVVLIWSLCTMLTGLTRHFLQFLIVRAMIAMNEAFNLPLALSLIPDVFDRRSRATATSILYSGPAIASLVGFPLIAALAAHHGWRAGFFAAGMPGLLIALLLFTTVREPSRERSTETHSDNPSLRESFAAIVARGSMVHLMLGMTIVSVVNSGQIAWTVPFLMRSHAVSLETAALTVSVAFGVTNGVGHLIGGAIADRVGRGDPRHYPWFVAAASAATCALILISTLAGSFAIAVAGLAGWALAASFQYGPVMGSIQTLAPPRMRGIATSACVLGVNLIGAGGGPFLAGMLSDRLAPSQGAQALPLALAMLALLHVWALLHFLRAGTTIRQDMTKSSCKNNALELDTLHV